MAYDKIIRRKLTPTSDMKVCYQSDESGRKVLVARDNDFPDLYVYIENDTDGKHLKKFSHYNDLDWSVENTALNNVLYKHPMENAFYDDHFGPAQYYGYMPYINPTYTIKYVPDKDRICLFSQEGVSVYKPDGILESTHALCYTLNDRYITAIDITPDNRFVVVSAKNTSPIYPGTLWAQTRLAQKNYLSVYDWNGTEIKDEESPIGYVSIMKVHPDGRIFTFNGRRLREFDKDFNHVQDLTNYTCDRGWEQTTYSGLMCNMAFDSRGNIILAGCGTAEDQESPGTAEWSGSVFSIAPDGSMNWFNTMYDSYYIYYSGGWYYGGDEAHNLFIDADDNVICYGKGNCNAGGQTSYRVKFDKDTGERLVVKTIPNISTGIDDPSGYEMCERWDYDKCYVHVRGDSPGMQTMRIKDEAAITSFSHKHELMRSTIATQDGDGLVGLTFGGKAATLTCTNIDATAVECATHATKYNIQATFTITAAEDAAGGILYWRSSGAIVDSGAAVIDSSGSVTITTDDSLCISSGTVTIHLSSIISKHAQLDYSNSIKNDTVTI